METTQIHEHTVRLLTRVPLLYVEAGETIQNRVLSLPLAPSHARNTAKVEQKAMSESNLLVLLSLRAYSSHLAAIVPHSPART
jgi:hypothetical protein